MVNTPKHQRRGDQKRAQHVSAIAQSETAIWLEQPPRQANGHDADGQVDEEDPVPVEGLRQEAARQQTDRTAGGGHETEDADRPRSFTWLGEQRHDHAQDQRRCQRAADALHEPRGDQQLLARGQATQQRRDAEHHQARDQNALATEQIAQPPGQQQQATERDQIGIDHPRQARLREAQVALNRWQGNVDNGLVQDDHQHPGAQDHEREPAVAFSFGGTSRNRVQRQHGVQP